MNLSYYKPSHLESWISSKYNEIGILVPGDLDPHNIVAKLDIEFYKDPVTSFCIREEGVSYLYVKNTIHHKEQRVQFFHELFHLFMHSGNQLEMMPQALRELQERDANHFVRYAAIPLHMLKDVNLESPSVTNELTETFCVPNDLVVTRLESIKRKIHQETSHQAFVEDIKRRSVTPYPKYRKFNLENCSNETKQVMERLNQLMQKKGETTNA